MLSAFCFAVMPRMISAQTVSEEARRHMDRGQAAIEMATTPEDLNDATKEFQKAIDLAPAWPDPYYNIGMTQNKMERFDDALKNLRSYLQLAPNAGNAQEVQQIVNKIEYKKDRENQVKKAFELFGSDKSDCKIISQKNSDGEGGITSRFSTQNGVLGIVNSYMYYSVRQDVPSYRVWSGYVKRRPEWSPWVPVHVNGRSYEYTYIYVVPTVHKRKGAYLVVEVKGTGELISLDPIRAKTMVTSRQIMIISEKGEAEAWDFAETSEIVEECRQRAF
jgi:tetratricopeptide (TPR) repeat protein